MRIVCQQTILVKFHALLLFLEKQQNLKLSSAANYRWRFMGQFTLPEIKDLRTDNSSLLGCKDYGMQDPASLYA